MKLETEDIDYPFFRDIGKYVDSRVNETGLSIKEAVFLSLIWISQIKDFHDKAGMSDMVLIYDLALNYILPPQNLKTTRNLRRWYWARRSSEIEQTTQLDLKPYTAEFVYLIRDKFQPGLYKIGRSVNPDRRAKQLNKTSLPEDPPSEAKAIFKIECLNAKKTESDLHRYYLKFRYRREWFDLPDHVAERFPIVVREFVYNDRLPEHKRKDMFADEHTISQPPLIKWS